MAGLREAMQSLKNAGCRTVYIDGSFVTDKEIPGDFDACWEEAWVDPLKLDPVLLTFADGRAAQKAKYLGSCFRHLHKRMMMDSHSYNSSRRTETPENQRG